MKLETLAAFFIIAAAVVSSSSASYWFSEVVTDTSSWYIYRESYNISFESSGSVEGTVSPLELHGRNVSPHLSYYAELGANDVKLRARTSALEGSYKSQDEILLQSNTDNEIDITIDKPAGSDIYTISYQEQWPAVLRASRTIDYSGRQISDRDLEANNGDFVSSSFLYNRELSEERRSIIWLKRMNATVLATDEAILLAEFKPTKYLGYTIKANSSGIADLRYRFRDPQYDLKHHVYPPISEGEERYYGRYNLSRLIEMRSTYESYEGEEDWMPCCDGGWEDMGYFKRRNFGPDVNEVFNCTDRCPIRAL